MRNLRITKSKADRKLAQQIRKCIRKDKFHKLQALTADIHPDSILNSKGQNGIHLSSKYGNPDCLSFFIRKGTDKKLKDKKGNIGLHFSAKFCMKHPYPALVRDLVTKPFMDDLNLMNFANKKGTTPKVLIDALNQIMSDNDQDLSSDSSSQDSADMDSWEDKMKNAYDEDISEARGSFHVAEEDYKNCFNETYDEWADRIYTEFVKKRRPSKVPRIDAKSKDDEGSAEPEKKMKLKLKQSTSSSSSVSTKALCLKQMLESSETITIKKIPFTLQSQPESIISVLMMGDVNQQENDSKKMLREALRIWHPDKFFQKFNSRIKAEEKDDIRKLVNFISTVLLHY